jgi:hypothetical protein
MVADNDSGKSVMSQVRTSSGTFLAKREVWYLNNLPLFSYANVRYANPLFDQMPS